MIRDKYERTIKQFETYYPDLIGQVVDWWASGRTSIALKMNDGNIYDYDPMDDSLRRVNVYMDVDEEAERKAFGSNLQKMIPFSGLSKGELAEEAGITNAMLSRYIRGNSMPSVLVARRIAKALGCRVDELFDDIY